MNKFFASMLATLALTLSSFVCHATLQYPVLLDQFVEDIPIHSPENLQRHKEVIKNIAQRKIEKAITLVKLIVDSNLAAAEFAPLNTNLGVLYGAHGDNNLGIHTIDQTLVLITTESGSFDPLLYHPLIIKALILKNAGRLKESEDIFRYAQNLLHRNEGVYTINQLAVIEQLSAIEYLQNEDLQSDREQRFYLLVSEKHPGKDNVNLISSLNKVAGYFAQRAYYSAAGRTKDSQETKFRSSLFYESFRLYDQSLHLMEKTYGQMDTRLTEPLKNIANVRILYGSGARIAEKHMQRAQHIVTSHPASSKLEAAKITINLADVYIRTANPKAGITYTQAWEYLSDSDQNRLLRAEFFSTPTRIYPKSVLPLVLEKFPIGVNSDEPLYVELEFSVNKNGRAYQIEKLGANVSNQAIRKAKANLQSYQFRPRIVEGTPVTTEKLIFRQMFVVNS